MHAVSRAVRRCFLMGNDPVSGKNFDHRKAWIEEWLCHFAMNFGIDLLTYSILSNHFHLVLRSRPDVVATWDDTEVAQRWLRICPKRKQKDGSPAEPTEKELNAIRNCPEQLQEIRSRLSDISWWMRLICQRIATRANKEEGAVGHFWEGRFSGTRILDEASLLACTAYVELNPIRAAMAETLEESEFTAIRRRIESMTHPTSPAEDCVDCFLSPLFLDEESAAVGPAANSRGCRCSDKGFLPMRIEEYLSLLDWTARQAVPGKRGTTPADYPPILARMSIEPSVWCELAGNFGRLFSYVAGSPKSVDNYRPQAPSRFYLRSETRELFNTSA